ncbi:MAG: hypothetical protein HYV09_23180 [Deltaproteobacteria bacterium]|nr:hypothetical protein [Deltaproteobacteria bacterium]
MRRTPLLAPLALAALLVTPAAPAAPEEAAAGAGADCVIKGKGVLEKGVFIYSAREGGTPIAGFATQEVTLEVSDVPADPTASRAKVKTGKGGGSVRIEGWLDATKIPISARTDIALAPTHVWIGRGEQLKLKGASPGKLQVEATISATQQKLKTKAACNEVTVGRLKVDEFQIPAGSKKYVLKKTSVELLDEPKGDVVFTLEVPVAEGGVLLYSSENKAGYTRVQHGGSLVIDAWAKTADLKPFPKGEMLDALAASNMVSISPAKLKVEGSTKEVKVTKDVALRLSANEAVKPIGVAEDGAELIVIDTVGEWSRVFPKGLEIIPPDGKDFWVKAKDLP